MKTKSIKPQITFLNFPPSLALKQRIEKKIEKLYQFYDRIMHCDVTIEQEDKKKHQGKEYRIRIVLTIPKDKLTVSHCHDKNVGIAIRDAFLAARRLLLNYRTKRKGKVKLHPLTQRGTVVKIFSREGYGFILSGIQEYYFSASNLYQADFDRLTIGAEVQFFSVVAKEGWQANRITIHKLPNVAERAIKREKRKI